MIGERDPGSLPYDQGGRSGGMAGEHIERREGDNGAIGTRISLDSIRACLRIGRAVESRY